MSSTLPIPNPPVISSYILDNSHARTPTTLCSQHPHDTTATLTYSFCIIRITLTSSFFFFHSCALERPTKTRSNLLSSLTILPCLHVFPSIPNRRYITSCQTICFHQPFSKTIYFFTVISHLVALSNIPVGCRDAFATHFTTTSLCVHQMHFIFICMYPYLNKLNCITPNYPPDFIAPQNMPTLQVFFTRNPSCPTFFRYSHFRHLHRRIHFRGRYN